MIKGSSDQQSESDCYANVGDGILNILVLGLGNMLLSDEGAGGRAVEELKRLYAFPSEVEIIDGGTMGFELLPYLEGRSHLLVVDAVTNNGIPGSTVRLELDDPPAYFRTRLSPHQIGLADILALASMEGYMPPKTILFGIEPKDLSTGLEISPEVEAGISRLVEMVVEEIGRFGCPVADMQ
jgi:hydrogenase maturation protease